MPPSSFPTSKIYILDQEATWQQCTEQSNMKYGHLGGKKQA